MFTLADLSRALLRCVGELEAVISIPATKKAAAELEHRLAALTGQRAAAEQKAAAAQQALADAAARHAEQKRQRAEAEARIRALEAELARVKERNAHFDPEQAAEIHMAALGFDTLPTWKPNENQTHPDRTKAIP